MVFKKGDVIVLKPDAKPVLTYTRNKSEYAKMQSYIAKKGLWVIDSVLSKNLVTISTMYPVSDCEIGCLCSNINISKIERKDVR